MSHERPTLSVVVPTKNRLGHLERIVRSLMAQAARIDELIVVDQSDDERGRAVVERIADAQPDARRPRLRYVWDPAIEGAAAARNAGLDLATSEVVACLDDDMGLEPETLERILDHFRRSPEIDAISPVITNYTPPSRVHRLFARIFCRGPFHDERQPLYWSWRTAAASLVPVRILNGGLMTFRRASLADARFDRRYRGASCGEDIDLSWTLAGRGARLAFATDARVAHERAPRPPSRHEETMLTSWAFVWKKHGPRSARGRLAFAWFVTGVVLESLVASARQRTLAPLRSTAAGLRSLTRDFAGSPFLTAAEGVTRRAAGSAPGEAASAGTPTRGA